MKKILVIIITILTTISLTGCVNEDYNSNVVNNNEELNQNDQPTEENISEKITMTVKDGTLTNSEVTLIVTNNTNDEYYYGLEFSLEKNVSGSWQALPLLGEFSYAAEVLSVEGKKTIEDKVNWLDEYGNLGSGTYRLTKKYMGKEIINASVEFSI